MPVRAGASSWPRARSWREPWTLAPPPPPHGRAWYNAVMNHLLIGARGSGKTSIGRLLAQRLERPFIDLDEVALGRFAESTVRAVWERHGEAAWRRAEAAALDEVLARDGGVIALGGGTPIIPAARAMLLAARSKRAVRVIYLRCEGNELCRRLAMAPGDRPRLTGLDERAEVERTLAQRAATYEELADVICDVAGREPQEIAAELVGAAAE